MRIQKLGFVIIGKKVNAIFLMTKETLVIPTLVFNVYRCLLKLHMNNAVCLCSFVFKSKILV